MLISSDLLPFGPNVIGATGGSGTRVVARIARQGGMFIGSNLNASEDALDISEYLDRWINTFIRHWDAPLSRALEAEMTQGLKEVLEKHCVPLHEAARPWGWKEPRSIYLLPFLHRQFPKLKFLHVLRDGRDMAYSSNQNQLRKHGSALLNWTERFRSQPLQSIALWGRINLLAADYGENELPGQYLLIRFEDLCAEPVPTIQRIFDFFGLQGDPYQIARIEVAPPESLGRWRKEDKYQAELHQIGQVALRKFGYANAGVIGGS